MNYLKRVNIGELFLDHLWLKRGGDDGRLNVVVVGQTGSHVLCPQSLSFPSSFFLFIYLSLQPESRGLRSASWKEGANLSRSNTSHSCMGAGEWEMRRSKEESCWKKDLGTSTGRGADERSEQRWKININSQRWIIKYEKVEWDDETYSSEIILTYWYISKQGCCICFTWTYKADLGSFVYLFLFVTWFFWSNIKYTSKVGEVVPSKRCGLQLSGADLVW